MRSKRVSGLVLVGALLAMLIQPVFVLAGTTEVVTYLKNQTADAWTVMALAAAGQTGINTDQLKSVSGTVVTDYAKTILALAAVNQNPATFGPVDYIAQLKTFHTASQMGDPNLLNDDIWSILALGAVNQSQSPEAVDAKNYLIAHQNSDGGWGYGLTASSDSNDTAAAIMALREAGTLASDTSITNAVTYLHSVQNEDGGFGYQVGSESDSGSDAWVISALSKLGQDPATWVKNGQTPLDHLLSLQDTDGGFWWMKVGTAGNNKAMTAFVAVALAGKSYPVGYYQSGGTGGTDTSTFHLRIEGKTSTLCDANVAATTALDIVKQAASVCGFTYIITDSSFGQYLSAVGGDQAAGMTGWMYLVNNTSPDVGAADYALRQGDDITWYYGEWGWNPTRLAVDKTTVDVNGSVHVTAQYYNGTDWLPMPNAVIAVNNQTQTTSATGQLDMPMATAGAYTLFINSPTFIRSPKVTVSVGTGVTQNVGLQANVVQGQVDGSSIMLVISADHLDFGAIKPGQHFSQNLTLDNQGTGAVEVRAQVSGDQLFIDNITIDSGSWSDYSKGIAAQSSIQAAVALNIPSSYTGSGIKHGDLVIWAQAK